MSWNDVRALCDEIGLFPRRGTIQEQREGEDNRQGRLDQGSSLSQADWLTIRWFEEDGCRRNIKLNPNEWEPTVHPSGHAITIVRVGSDNSYTDRPPLSVHCYQIHITS